MNMKIMNMKKFCEIVICVLCGALVVFICAASIWEVSHIEEIGTAKLYWDDHYRSLAITTHKQGYLVDRGDFLAFRRAGEGDEVTYAVRPGVTNTVVLWPEKVTVEEMKTLCTLEWLKPLFAFAVVGVICLVAFLTAAIKSKKSRRKAQANNCEVDMG